MRAAFAFASLCLLLAAVSAETPTAALLPVPELAAQARARDMIRNLYKADYARKSPADRASLAKTLLNQAAATRDDATARYVALTEAVDLACGAGDAATALGAIEQTARSYAINALEMKRYALLRALPNTNTVAEAEAVMRLALDVADLAAAVDAFDVVQQLANLAESAGNKTRQVRAAASIQVRLADLRGLSAEFAQVRQSLVRLDRNPADAEAHLIVGRFYALHKGQWPLGLPHLAEGSDDQLRALAQKELAHPADDFTQVQLGDAWWDYAEKSTGLTRRHASAHAAEWYQAAQRTLQGITLARIQARIRSGLPGAAAAAPLAPAGTIDLLPLIDPAKDVGQGNWFLAAGGVACESSGYATLGLPYVPPEEFDLRVGFTRIDDNGSLAVLLATHGRNFGYALDVKGEARFERVDGKIAKDNPTLTPVVISNGHRYTLTIQVRNDAVRALLEDKLLTEWKTDYKDLSRYSLWKFPKDSLCALGANNAKVVFHSVQLIEITGKGKPAR